MLEQFDEVLVQEYVAGREFNVGIIEARHDLVHLRRHGPDQDRA